MSEQTGAAPTFARTRIVNGHTLTRWDVEQIAAFEQWVQEGRGKMARKAIGFQPDLPPVQRETIIAQEANRPVLFFDLINALSSESGSRQAVLLSLRMSDPRADAAAVKAVAPNAGSALGLATWLVGAPEPEPDPTTAGNVPGAQAETTTNPTTSTSSPSANS